MAYRVLIADDAGFVREILRMVCVSYGYEVVAEAQDGEEAVSLAIQHQPDVVIIDLVMPKLNGIAAAEAIKSSCPDTQLVAISTLDQSEMSEKAMHAGCVAYLKKPFSRREVGQVLSQIGFESTKGAQNV